METVPLSIYDMSKKVKLTPNMGQRKNPMAKRHAISPQFIKYTQLK